MTPREFQAVVDAHREAEQISWLPMATLLALTANIHRDPQRRAMPFKPIDFIPGYEAPPMSEEDILAVFDSLAVDE